MPRRASAPTTLPAAGVAAVILATANVNVAASIPSPSDSSPLPSSHPGSSSASTSNAGGAARPRRIMPSRSRRGGPGVGISDVDTQILETLRRRRENDPLIPAHTQLLLTTDSTRVRTFGGGDAGSQLNTSAYERYFDKPEVIRAYREQQLIQTPEYTLLSEHEAVGGRFRPRGQDDEGIDTSDAAYEKRHRKYETFEKRQRLREKEKLKHEQYKLKERIEQLRALEPSAFLHVADSFFTSSLCPPPHEAGAEQDANAVPAQVHCDGEWRKRQILDVANGLEARYRTLLDTAPSRAPELSTPTPAPATPAPAPVPPPKTATPVPAPNHTPAPTSPVVPRPLPVLPPTEPTEIIELDSDGEEQSPEPVKVEPALQPLAAARLDPNETIRLRIKFPTRPPPPVLPSPIPSPMSAPAAVGTAIGSPSPTRPRPKPIFKNPAAPGPYARVPFARRLSLQDGAACAGTSVPVSSPATPTSSAPHTVPPATPTTTETASPLPARPAPASATHLTLRRRPPRAAAAHLKPVSPIAATTTTPAILPPPAPPPAPAPGLKRPRKRRRVELSDDVPSPASDSYDNTVDATGAGAEEEGEEQEQEPEPEEDGEDDDDESEEEEEEDGPGGVRRRSGAREQRRERWRECALYREAQRHVGAPSARKTHRHLGIFGLRGFPADIEHMRDFVPPTWALPRGDLRLVQGGADATCVVPMVASVGVGAGGAGGTDKEAGHPVVMAVTVAEEVDETLLEVEPAMSDPLTTVETPKTVDSQETEDLILPLNC
ncbi:hypothetical protein EDB87DRAFT_830292 [Lactarius vividus]|nr:hypothetical protein EDB87DRAFT_830292 [Lactarius vividus]